MLLSLKSGSAEADRGDLKMNYKVYSINNIKKQEKRFINYNLKEKLRVLKLESAKEKAKEKAAQKYQDVLQELEQIKQLIPAKEIIISVEWKKSYMWGYNPHATIKIFNNNGGYEIFEETASGCGYDKLSSVVSYGFNKSKLLKAYLFKRIRKLNKILIEKGYNLYALDKDFSFMGGCGISTYRTLFQALGCKFEHYSTDNSDFIKIDL